MFKKATKLDARLRLALSGPAGSGKSYSALALARELAGEGGKIAAIDTEHGSLSKYADEFVFDVVEPSVFDPRELVKTIEFAESEGYSVLIVDSLSHYWMGKGGELDLVDGVAKRSNSGNSFAAWKTVTPYHNALVDKIIASSIHIIVTMRTKTEWVMETNDRGKQVPRKIGLAPVMRDGIEFEFDVCGELDQDNNLVVTKSRCSKLANQVVNRPGKQMADVLREWLAGEARPVEQPKQQTVEPQRQKVSELPANPNKLPVDINAIRAKFEEAKSILGPAEYHRILKEEYHVENASDFSKQGGLRKYQECYDRMMARAQEIATEAVPA